MRAAPRTKRGPVVIEAGSSLGQASQTHTLGKPGKILGSIRPDPIFEVGKTQFRIKVTDASKGFLRFVQTPAECAAGRDISYGTEKIRLFPGRLCRPFHRFRIPARDE